MFPTKGNRGVPPQDNQYPALIAKNVCQWKVVQLEDMGRGPAFRGKVQHFANLHKIQKQDHQFDPKEDCMHRGVAQILKPPKVVNHINTNTLKKKKNLS